MKFPSNCRTFEGADLLQISMPMGGIGAGCICLSGHGALQDFSIRNKPATTALADTITGPTDGGFALLHVRGKRPITKLLEGPLPSEKIYDQSLQAQGYRKGGHEGLPRFSSAKFVAAFPTGQVELADDELPIGAKIAGWSPFIPLDDRGSGMPCAIVEYQLTNTGAHPLDIEFSYHLSHLPRGDGGWKNTRNQLVDGGVQFYNTVPANDETFGTATLTVIGCEKLKPVVKAMWMRGGWFDWISKLWEEVSTGTFTANAGNTDRGIDGHNGGSILVPATLTPGQSITIPVLITWHVPNVYLTMARPDSGQWWLNPPPVSNVPAGQGPAWRPWYAGQWTDAAAVAAEIHAKFETLRSKTLAFRDALFESTLPVEAIDAVASNLAILKSPTVLRQENGNLWGWEGCFTNGGCCPGSCLHVWNYAQSLPHLFPQLERTLREAEYLRSIDEVGFVDFRSALPDGKPARGPMAADGQLGGIMKLYRDWHINGDDAWMRRLLPLARHSLDYCTEVWDPDRRGALFEPHHNTYDIEFWGPDGMCTSVYVGALSAMAAMLKYTGDSAADSYADLAAKAARYCDQHLYNGEYYQQQTMWHELKDKSFNDRIEKFVDQTDPALLDVFRKDGPPYQYGSGCLSDGIIGQWMASLYGIDTPLDEAHVRSTLGAIFKYNFRADLSAYPCTQRPGYAIGHEPGLILCTWPNGGRPTLPFVYSDEVWTGIEHQVSSHLISQGLLDEGMTIVRGVRSRYNGRVRNPFNEYECGSYYARAMSSYALLQSFSGVRYSQVSKTLWASPKTATKTFKGFLSTATGYGTVQVDTATLYVRMVDGELAIDQLILGQGREQRVLNVRKVATTQQVLQIATR